MKLRLCEFTMVGLLRTLGSKEKTMEQKSWSQMGLAGRYRPVAGGRRATRAGLTNNEPKPSALFTETLPGR
jgi:hypothetical protein